MTRQRQVIHDILTARPLHLTAEQIFEQAQLVLPDIARGTVYRNLGLMVAAGEVRKLELPEGPARYDRDPAPHAHLVCERCGALEDLPLEGLLEQLSALSGQKLTGCDVMLYHQCKNCR